MPSLVRLALDVVIEANLRLKPLGTLYAVISAQPRQIFRSLGILPLCQMPGRLEICLDLVDVPIRSQVEYE